MKIQIPITNDQLIDGLTWSAILLMFFVCAYLIIAGSSVTDNDTKRISLMILGVVLLIMPIFLIYLHTGKEFPIKFQLRDDK